MRGRVLAFDEHAGYGTVQAEDGRELFFHCTAIADGSRTIAVDADITFEIVPGHSGKWEATAVRLVSLAVALTVLVVAVVARSRLPARILAGLTT